MGRGIFEQLQDQHVLQYSSSLTQDKLDEWLSEIFRGKQPEDKIEIEIEPTLDDKLDELERYIRDRSCRAEAE